MEIDIIDKDYANRFDLFFRDDKTMFIVNLTRQELKELKEKMDKFYGDRDNGK